jgi:hypothetical protein
MTRLMSWLEREAYIGEAAFALLIEYQAESLGDSARSFSIVSYSANRANFE